MSRKHRIPEQPGPAGRVRTHLFHFTDREEIAIARAIEKAKRFMEKYGCGRKPRMIDRSKYE